MNVLGVISDILPSQGHLPQDILCQIKDPGDSFTENVNKSTEYETPLIDVDEAFDSLCLNEVNVTKQNPLLKCDLINGNKVPHETDGSSLPACKEKALKSTLKSRYISIEEVAGHCSMASCWIIIHGKVYDVTNFLKEHPGGKEIILEHAGWDASSAFVDVGHSTDALALRECYYIGELQTQV